jgi:dihydroxyacid dehydratase/phosphogluconate dehydratase
MTWLYFVLVQSVFVFVGRPSPWGHLQCLYGNIAPEGSVAKITGKEGLYFKVRGCTAAEK